MSRLKQFKTIDEQIEILKDKGLIINDVEKTKEILLRENYENVKHLRTQLIER